MERKGPSRDTRPDTCPRRPGVKATTRGARLAQTCVTVTGQKQASHRHSGETSTGSAGVEAGLAGIHLLRPAQTLGGRTGGGTHGNGSFTGGHNSLSAQIQREAAGYLRKAHTVAWWLCSEQKHNERKKAFGSVVESVRCWAREEFGRQRIEGRTSTASICQDRGRVVELFTSPATRKDEGMSPSCSQQSSEKYSAVISSFRNLESCARTGTSLSRDAPQFGKDTSRCRIAAQESRTRVVFALKTIAKTNVIAILRSICKRLV